jgi:hypothetical protein
LDISGYTKDAPAPVISAHRRWAADSFLQAARPTSRQGEGGDAGQFTVHAGLFDARSDRDMK